MKRSALLLLLGLAAAAWVAAAAAGAARADTLDDRVYAIANQLMCPVCAGETVAQSDSAVAREMRQVIRAKLQAGEPPDAILKFFVGQFGESVLAEPPRRGLSLFLYLGPAAGVLGGLAIAVLCIRRWTSRPAPVRRGTAAAPRPAGAHAGPPPPNGGAPPAPTPDELARLARELEARDRF
jgi:cytochrome c-type biogenesis protein CcmH